MHRRPSALRQSALLLVAAALAGCGRAGETTRWTELARGFRPASEEAGGDGGSPAPASAGRARLRLDAERGGTWVEVDVAAERWRPSELLPGHWLLDRPLCTGFLNLVDETVRLASGDGEIPEAPPPRRGAVEAYPEDVFYLTPLRVHLSLPEGVTPPDLTLSTFVSSGSERDGVWHTAVGGESGAGLSVWPGHAEVVRCDLPPRSALRFRTAYERFEELPEDARSPVSFRVLLDGAEVFAFQGEPDGTRATRHVVPLPSKGARGAELEFRVEGDPGVAAFFGPVVGPAEVGTYGQRPWGAARPDVLLFLIDTFRADNLEPYGGEPGLAPRMNAFAARSVRFLRAYAPSAWTLPSHASMLSGLFPRQHGATDKGRTFADGVTTIAEHLAELGYRTGAVTDSGFIGRSYGFDQGFEWFDETDISSWNLRRTFAASLDFLARDDGRPTFLFVHTYRTHAPYRRGADEDVSRWHELMAELEIDGAQWGNQEENSPLLAARAQDFLALYHEGVAGLDELFGPWVSELEARGFFANGYLVLTSDHGEAFSEHGDMLHGGTLWEEKIRVPLLIRGDALEPRDVSLGASLVDLPRTIAALARSPAPEAWGGSALLELTRDRPLFAFGEEMKALGSHLAIVEGSHKILAACDPARLAAGEHQRAFDLGVDPAELADLAGRADWAEELARRLAPAVEALDTNLLSARAVELGAEQREKLKAIGYGGDDGDG